MNIHPFKLLLRSGFWLAAMSILVSCSSGDTSSGLERGDGGAVVGQPAQGNNSPANSGGAAPASAGATQNDTACFTGYVQSYADLNAAYQSGGTARSISDWGKGHYLASGQAEGRTLPAGCKAPSPGATAVSNASAKPAFSPLDYQLLYRINAASNGGTTVRWPSRTIGINATDAGTRAAVSRWKGFNFNFGTGGGINFQGASQQRGHACGWSQFAWRHNGEIAFCKIWLNPVAHEGGGCGTMASTITHEVGHCLGLDGHTADGGLMDKTAASANVITANVNRTLNLLYSLPPGASLTTAGRATTAPQSSPTSAGGLIYGPIIEYHGQH